MPVRIAINGLGRIGRTVLRIIATRNLQDIEVVAVNDLTDTHTLAHLLRYDSIHGKFPTPITVENNALIVGGRKIQVFQNANPAELPWKDLNVDIVLEATGKFRTYEKAYQHIQAGARKVVVSAPCKGAVKTIVLGINENILTAEDQVISNASCTTNCLAPMVYVLDQEFGIEYGLMNTVHAYTADQRLQDAPHKDLRRARAAAHNIVPTTTGAAEAVAKVLPHLEGRLTGMAMRVPVINGSITDFVCTLQKDVDVQTINETFQHYAQNTLAGILRYCDEPIVSSDIIGDPHSCIFDALSTTVIGKRMVRVVGWYDNEYGYSARLVDLILLIYRKFMA